MSIIGRSPRRYAPVGLIAAGAVCLSGPVAAQVSSPQTPSETVVITATRSERSITDVPQSVAVLSDEQVLSTPAFALDDVLRTVPSVILPNAPSYQLHPTADSISMRGLGGTRALVLLDGVPINDAFFGYVQWSRVPMENIERIEVVRGGGATLWGNYAMGGVINIITRAPERNEFAGEAGYGSYGTYRANVYGAVVASENIKLNSNIGYSSTDGYDQYPAAYDAPLYIPTSFEAWNFAGTANVTLSPTWSGLFRINYHSNNQVLGTPLSTNKQHVTDYSGSVTKAFGADTSVTVNAFHSDSWFRTDNVGTPSCCATGFAEFVQNRHTTPVSDTGASVLLNTRFGDMVPLVSIGADLRVISGEDTGDIFDETGVQIRTDIGSGKQRFVGVFGQASVMPFDRLEVLASARQEWITHYDGFDGNPGGVGDVPDAEMSSFDPRISLRYAVTPNFALRAAAYKAFRAPTLDNLYRAFSVPFGIFYPDAQLKPERLKGAEIGFDWNFESARFAVTAYTSDVTDLLTFRNLDFSELPPGFFFGSRNINAGAARARGVEAELNWQISSGLSALLGYAFADSVLTDNPLEPVSVGHQLAGVPQHRASLGLTYQSGRAWRVSGRVRYISKSYGDNAHTFPVDEQFVVDVSAAYPIYTGTELFVDIENLFDNHYIADNSGFSPPLLGKPFTAFGGVRVRFN